MRQCAETGLERDRSPGKLVTEVERLDRAATFELVHAVADAVHRAAERLAQPPGVAIVVTVLGFNLLGDGLRDLLDPTTRHAVA